MKKITLLFAVSVFFIAFKSFAKQRSDKYCSDPSKKVLYVKVNLSDSEVNKEHIGEAELVTELNNGTAVLIPCLSNYGIPKDRPQVDSVIVDQSNVFQPVSWEKSKNITIIGLNYETSNVLVEKDILFVLKKYFIRHSNILSRQGRN